MKHSCCLMSTILVVLHVVNFITWWSKCNHSLSINTPCMHTDIVQTHTRTHARTHVYITYITVMYYTHIQQLVVVLYQLHTFLHTWHIWHICHDYTYFLHIYIFYVYTQPWGVCVFIDTLCQTHKRYPQFHVLVFKALYVRNFCTQACTHTHRPKTANFIVLPGTTQLHDCGKVSISLWIARTPKLGETQAY